MVYWSDYFRVLRMLQWSLKTKSEGKEERKARKRRRKLKNREVKKASSCVSNISQLKHFLENPTVMIEDQCFRINISKFQFNPTVDEVTMTILVKEAW